MATQSMVYKKFCDRCKKELEDVNDNELYFTKTRNTRYGYDKRINLCDECLKEFDKFLENEEKKKEMPLL